MLSGSDRNLSGWTSPGESLKQEGHVTRLRVVKFVAGAVAVVAVGIWLYGMMGPKPVKAEPPAVVAVVPVAVGTRVQVAVLPTAVKVAANVCRALVSGEGYIKDSIYKVDGWSKALGGLLLVNGVGWRVLNEFSCPGLVALGEVTYVPPAVKTAVPKAAATAVVAATAVSSPTRVLAQPTATSTRGRVLSFQCGGGAHVSNRAGVALAISTPEAAWGTVLGPGGSFWVNPEGARVFVATGQGMEPLTFRVGVGCGGGTIQ